MAFELSAKNENFVSNDIYVKGERYVIVTYDNDEVLLIDDAGLLVSSTSTLNEVFEVKSFRELFNQSNLTSNNIVPIYDSIDILHSNAKLVNDLMTWLTVAAIILGISSIVVGGIAIPLTVIVSSVKFATNYIVDDIQTPRATISDLLSIIEKTESKNAEPLLFEQSLNKVDETKVQLTEFNNQLILDVTGIGNVAYYNALYFIADAIESVAGDQATDLRRYASIIETSQLQLDNALDWLNTLNTNNIQQSAATKTNNFIQLHKLRIETRSNEYSLVLSSTQNVLTEVRNNLNIASQKGYQTTEAYRVLSMTEPQIDTAKALANEYMFRTAMNMLEESTTSLQQIDSLIVRPEATTTTSSATSITTNTESNDYLYIFIVAILVLIIAYMIYHIRKPSRK